MALAIHDTAPLGTVVGVWSKSFPTGCMPTASTWWRASATAGPILNNSVKLRGRSKSKGRRGSTPGSNRHPRPAFSTCRSIGRRSGRFPGRLRGKPGWQPAGLGHHRLRRWLSPLAMVWKTEPYRPVYELAVLLLLSCFVAFGTVLVFGSFLGWRPALSTWQRPVPGKMPRRSGGCPGLKRDAVCGTSVCLDRRSGCRRLCPWRTRPPWSRLVRLGRGSGRRCWPSGRNTD